jgi:hypothetical protein
LNKKSELCQSFSVKLVKSFLLKILLKRYNIAFTDSDLKLVLTHSSFAEKNNSRYVFLGQSAFRGAAGEWIFRCIPGTGMQLQQFWGNCFKQHFLETFFDKLNLNIRRINPEIKPETQKHIFVFALLGYIFEKADAADLQRFIFQQIIMPNDRLLPAKYKFRNSWDMLIVLCRQHYGCRPKIEITVDDSKIQRVVITKNGEMIASHHSVSYTYARKKAIEKALKFIADDLEEKLVNSPRHRQVEELSLQNRQDTEQQLKEEKLQKHLKRNAEQQERMTAHREKKKREAQEADRKRRTQKQEVKEKKSKKGANTIYREYTREEIAAMSSAKRRNLQDKGIIPKGLDF